MLSSASLAKSVIDDLIYVIARDNEIEYLVEYLARSEASLILLARHIASSTESDAKWQVANRLGSVKALKSEAEELLLWLVKDDTEYVRRRALLALGALGSGYAESLAEQAWLSGDEYQQMAALEVFKLAGSHLLLPYAQRALQDSRPFLVAFANRILAE